ncbi:MAG: phosphotransferase family protein [Acidobacteriota bacterium]
MAEEKWIDQARQTREGEELDADRLGAYLREHIDEAEGDLEIEQFPSGFSNLTYLLSFGPLELVLRRPPFGNRVKSAHDMGREFLVLSSIAPLYPLAPRPYLYCEDEDILGAPFYVMQRHRGVVLRRQMPRGMTLSPVLAGRLCERFIDNLATLHTLDYRAAGLGDLGRPEGYVQRQVQGWLGRYQKAQTDGWAEFDQAGAWLADNLPRFAQGEEAAAAALIHNDYKYDNVLLAPSDLTRLVAVLDWEMCTVGHPLMDLGTTLAYWVEASDAAPLRASAFGPTWVPGSWTRQQLAERYAERTGSDLGSLLFYGVFGYYKLGVIVQQIYYRYFQGHTRDPRFAQLNQLVGLLGQVAAGALERGRL